MFHRRFLLMTVLALFFSANVSAGSQNTQTQSGQFIDQATMRTQMNAMEQRLTSQILDLKRQVNALKEKLYQLENRSGYPNPEHQQGNTVHLPTTPVQHPTVQHSASTTVWACFLSPTFEKIEFMGTSPNKSAAIFDVVSQCKRAGIDGFYCNQSNVTCKSQ